jgi:hypothetical protein
MRRLRHALYLALLVSTGLSPLLATLPAQATQILLQTPQEMGSTSELVAQGTVSEVRSFWNESGTKIFTEVRVDVTQAHKGFARGSLNIVQLGGEVDGVRMSVAGTPSWQIGEEILVFLEASKNGGYRVAGFSQGKFLVERDARTGEAFVRRPALLDTELMARAGVVAPDGADGELRIPLDRFLDESLPQIREED